MTILLLIFRLSLLIVFISSLSSCVPVERNTFDISQLDESKITDFDLAPDEKVKYYRNIVLGKTDETFTRNYSACSNDKILISDKYIYLIENPDMPKALEYQLNIHACGRSSIRPTKSWKIAYDDIIKVEYIYFTYVFRLSGSDTPADTILIKPNYEDIRLIKSILKEMGVDVIDIGTFWGGAKYLRNLGDVRDVRKCSLLIKKWGIYIFGFTFPKNKHPAFWKKPECISKSGLWSKEGTKADTIYDANDKRLLYTGSLEKGNNCGPYTYSWVSTEEYEVDVCKGEWKSLDIDNKLPCDNGMKIKLRRLAIGNDGCYLYGDLADTFFDAYPWLIRYE